jgi:hypothetical protein
MSSRLPTHSGAEPQRQREAGKAELELRLQGSAWHHENLGLEAADFIELRRSIRIVRRLIAGRLALVKGMAAANDSGEAVDPLDDSATRFCVSGAFLRVSKPSPPLFAAWTRLCHQAAGDLLGDPAGDLFSYNDDPTIGREELLELLDEVEARLDLLAGRLEADDHA